MPGAATEVQEPSFELERKALKGAVSQAAEKRIGILSDPKEAAHQSSSAAVRFG